MPETTVVGDALNKQDKPGKTDGMEVLFYTDPLCCWSWAMEPQWRRLQYEYRDILRVVYKMIGLVPGWDQFHDAEHALQRPVHMGPEWVHAREVSGMPVSDRIWIVDPPASSFPACIAVKCAEGQSAFLGARYLRLVREAVMVQNRNIALTAVLMEVAAKLGRLERNFDVFAFRDDLLSRQGRDLFRLDYTNAQYLGIRRTPTLVFKGPGAAASGSQAASVMVRGYATYAGLQDALKRVWPALPDPMPIDEAEYRAYWKDELTTREIKELSLI